MRRTMDRAALAAISLTLACWGCGDQYSDERCDDLQRQIMDALLTNVNKQVFVATAVPCGPNGIANSPSSFDARVPIASKDYLMAAFAKACSEFEDHCE